MTSKQDELEHARRRQSYGYCQCPHSCKLGRKGKNKRYATKQARAVMKQELRRAMWTGCF